MMLAPRVAVAVAPVPIPHPIPTLKGPYAFAHKGYSIIAWQTKLAPDYRSGLIIWLLTSYDLGWKALNLLCWKPEAPKIGGAL